MEEWYYETRMSDPEVTWKIISFSHLVFFINQDIVVNIFYVSTFLYIKEFSSKCSQGTINKGLLYLLLVIFAKKVKRDLRILPSVTNMYLLSVN